MGALQTQITGVEGREDARDHTLQVQSLTRTVTALEARRRKRNFRLPGILETVGGDDLLPYVQSLMAKIGVKGSKDPGILLTAFQIRKAAAAAGDAPRDTIVMTRVVAVRTAILSHSRELNNIQFEGHIVAIYGDIPFAALMRQRQLAPIAKQLREATIRYRWGTDGSL
ncbi:Hypothetical predicted protein [Pelobates cultripes]|uniref:Uncharacterized protein n=1 Tax=Pelobates cultripes TaxID=61616 RepID=A0AAD1RPC4_PELCU|nr:Hypothetical predicted protein [Pelobates cultripes]